MTKAPTPAELWKGQKDNTNNATKKFDYTAVADRLRTVSWSNYGHPTCVVYQVYREGTIWTICAFRVLNPLQWSLAKDISWKSWTIMPKKCRKKLKKKGWCKKPQNYNFYKFKTENIDVHKTLQINRSRPWNLATCAFGDSLVHQQWHSPK